MTFSTDDCKNLLVEKFPDTSSKEWKRVKKYKNDGKVVCRDFEHAVKGIVVIAEKDSQLILVSQEDKVIDPSKIFYQKVFSPDDIKAAKKIVERFNDGDYEITFADEGFHAIPAILDFFFYEEDMDEDELKDIVKQKNMSLKPANLPFMVMNNYPKDEVNDMFGGYCREILPSYFNEVSESLFEIDMPNNYNVTIYDVFKIMFENGFVYNKKFCMFKNWLKDYTIIQRPESDLEKEAREVRKKATIAVLNDDHETFKDCLYKDSFNVDMTIGMRRLNDYCKYEDKPKCLQVLITKQKEDLDKKYLDFEKKGIPKVFDENKIFYQKTFNKEDVDNAKKLFDRLVDCSEEDKRNLNYSPIKFEEDGYNATPSLLEFYFNTEMKEYDKIEYKRIIKDKDMFSKPANIGLCIENIYPKDKRQTLLTLCTEHILPEFFHSDYMYDSGFEIDPFNYEQITIHDVFKKLLELGFVYNYKKCAFKEILHDYTIVEKLETDFDREVRDTRLKVQAAIKADNAEELDKYIHKESFDKNMTIDRYDLGVFCNVNKKNKCYRLLLNKNIIEG